MPDSTAKVTEYHRKVTEYRWKVPDSRLLRAIGPTLERRPSPGAQPTPVSFFNV
ncbi:hypothetical protein [Salicibibacter halophilus]|uniref:hypothetical protein n=1 Tax=Salicibibacter halophilus TaxID=2502791 RepID=UPI001358A7D3|nr:hypothetical protein [Salicibibacter halophilus]